ncbi:MAG: hypothetical protein ACTH2Y_08425 [Corynebacterium sp.]|uniref:hypothetical protein n=1 Tax=Corynebacterium sp. TaxID=1720 RepID=UPI003F937665
MTGASRFGDGSDQPGVFRDYSGALVSRAEDALGQVSHVTLEGSLEPWQVEVRQADLAEGERRRRAEATERARVLEALAAHGRGEFPELEEESRSEIPSVESLADVAARIYGDRPGELDDVAQRVTCGATADELDEIAARIYRR